MKMTLTFSLFILLMNGAVAQPLSMKDKVRLSLWFQGVQQEEGQRPAEAKKQAPQIEEIERPLRKLL